MYQGGVARLRAGDHAAIRRAANRVLTQSEVLADFLNLVAGDPAMPALDRKATPEEHWRLTLNIDSKRP